MQSLQVVCTSSRHVVVSWGYPFQIMNTRIDVTDLQDHQTYTYTPAPGFQSLLVLNELLEPGHSYKVQVRRWNAVPPLIFGDSTFRADFSREELQRLLDKAIVFVYSNHSNANNNLCPCNVLYRNKPPAYFQQIDQELGRIMQVTRKDNNGDPASPINSILHGLFFCASVDRRTGKPFRKSNFGTRRISIPEQYMFGIAPNLYFTDFYCMYEAHYVTLVMTRAGSPADNFCADKLLLLNTYENEFLERDIRDGNLYVTPNVCVEVFFTEHIYVNDALLHGARFTNTPTTGHSKPDGIPKNPDCSICNLY